MRILPQEQSEALYVSTMGLARKHHSKAEASSLRASPIGRLPAALYLAGPLLISPCSSLKLSFECVYRAERKLGCGVHVCNARLQLQKILPRAIFISLGTGLVTHADDHRQDAMAS